MSGPDQSTAFPFTESGIRQLHARCAEAVWRKDGAAFADCFVEDGQWVIAGVHARGRDQIRAEFDRFLALNERVLMRFGTPVLWRDGDAVVGRTFASEDIKTVGGRGLKTIGVYHERFVASGGGWLFERRQFDLHYFGARDLSDTFFDISE